MVLLLGVCSREQMHCVPPTYPPTCRPAPAPQMPRGTDSTFAAKLQQHHAGHPRFSYNAKATSDNFTVQVLAWHMRAAV